MPDQTPAEFRGFGRDLVDFYAGLELDNSKAYWEAHRDVFRSQVQEPMAALTGALSSAFGSFRIFRPHRDVRFSHDKSPYKTAHGALSETEGAVALYLHVSATGLLVATGLYDLERDQLARWREAVADPKTGGSLVRAIRTVRAADLVVDGGMRPALKTAPRGYPRDHPRLEWLQWKGCTAATEFEPVLARKAAAVDAIAKAWTDAAPLTRWLERHVGPSTIELDR